MSMYGVPPIEERTNDLEPKNIVPWRYNVLRSPFGGRRVPFIRLLAWRNLKRKYQNSLSAMRLYWGLVPTLALFKPFTAVIALWCS